MNILWLSHLVPYPPKGGVLQRSFNLIKEVAKYHKVYLFAFNQKALLPTEEGLNEAVRELKKDCEDVKVTPIPCEEGRYGRYPLYFKSLFTSQPFTIHWLRSAEMENLLAKAVEKHRIDLVHFDTISLVPFLENVKKYKKVLNHHNIESAMMLRRAEKESNLLRKMYLYQEGVKISAYEKQWCSDFDLNITCSRLDSERLLSQIPNLRVEEIPNGVDLEYFYPSNKEREEKSLIFAGGMNWYPNRDAMLFLADEIWPLLKKRIPDVKMTVIGMMPPERLIQLSKKDANFRATGYVDDVRPYIDKAAVYICPIRDGGGTRLKILDALAMAKPIVADPIACEGIDVIDGESVSFATTPQEYVEKIHALFNDVSIAARLGENGRRLIEQKYSFASIGRRLSSLYESV